MTMDTQARHERPRIRWKQTTRQRFSIKRQPHLSKQAPILIAASWVALHMHDGSYGLGHPFSINPNGGKEGKGEVRDLVWRSRSNNPVNKWYFERSTGHIWMGSWILFWCDAEKRVKLEARSDSGLSYIEDWKSGRFEKWAEVVNKIPSAWK